MPPLSDLDKAKLPPLLAIIPRYLTLRRQSSRLWRMPPPTQWWFAWKNEFLKNKGLGQVASPNVKNNHDFFQVILLLNSMYFWLLYQKLTYINANTCTHLNSYTLVTSLVSRFCEDTPDYNKSLWPHGLQPSRLICPRDSAGKNTGVGSRSLLQGIFSTQGSNLGLPHCGQILSSLSHHGSPHNKQ